MGEDVDENMEKDLDLQAEVEGEVSSTTDEMADVE